MFQRQATRLLSVQVPATAPAGAGYVATQPLGRPLRVIGVLLMTDKPAADVYIRFGHSDVNVTDASSAGAAYKWTDFRGASIQAAFPDYIPLIVAALAIIPFDMVLDGGNTRLWLEVQNKDSTNTVNVNALFIVDENPDSYGDGRWTDGRDDDSYRDRPRGYGSGSNQTTNSAALYQNSSQGSGQGQIG